ncbi:MAG TPA: hypothetical protein VHI95_15025 [Acidimicrobiales bacterium]|jgi:hypothetical protein|nr:hypothetical protein [Acidimicrobiales bacterium]
MTDVLDRLDVVEVPPLDPGSTPPTNRQRATAELNPSLLRVAASFSIAAGVIHLVMVPPHAGESMAEGLGFALAGWFQIITAWLLLTRKHRSILLPIAVANAAFIGAWVWSRTAGLPVGAHKGIKEAVGFVDLTTIGLEVALLVTCALLARRPRDTKTSTSKRGLHLALAVIIGVFALTTAAVASPGARNHGAHTHDDGTAAAGHDHGTTTVDDKGLSALSNGHHHVIGPELPLDPGTRAQLTHQIAVSQDTAKMFPTVAAAEAAGYHRAGPYSPGLGAHYIRPSADGLNFDGVMDDSDLLSPLAIIYAGTNPDAPIAGFMYYAMSKDEPQGFAGPNDHWHYHLNTCIKYNADGSIDAPFGADTEAPADLCVQAGGQVLEQTQYMVHVWSVPGWESQQGLFGEVNPALTCPDSTYYQLPLEQWKDHPLSSCLS